MSTNNKFEDNTNSSIERLGSNFTLSTNIDDENYSFISSKASSPYFVKREE